ncbi:MAG: peptide chain release factor N(5)-glutamine methyltransferase [Pseudobdellovibrio sp.]
MLLKEIFEKSVQFFKDKKIESARLDAELLISHALKMERLQIYIKYEQPVSEIETQKCRDNIRRRAQGEPVAYIIGEKGFYGDMYSVGEGVLIPRPETEQIVEEALSYIKTKSLSSPQILDLGAGSGCIGFAILKNTEGASLTSVEKSEAAFKYLKENQEKHKLQEQSRLLLNDVMEFNPENEKFDIIVANPPYIAENDPQTEINVKKFEPQSALFAADEGFKALFDWSAKFKTYLKPNGVMLFEMGYLQGAKIKQHCDNFKQFSEVKILKDLSGLDRIVKCIQ